MLIDADQGNSLSVISCAAGTSDAVDIVFRYIWKFKVDHVRELIDIQSPCSDVGCDQHTDVTVFEIFQSLCAGPLAFIAMDRSGSNPIGRQLCGKTIRPGVLSG